MASRPALSPAPVPPQRVLIVDDSAIARSVLERMVADGGGHVVAAVPDVAGALRCLAAHRADVILLDIEMPGIDGLTGLPDLLAAGAGAKVLVVSSAAAQGAAATIRALALGAADTLVKPGRAITAGGFAQALAEKLARLAEGGEPVALAVPQPLAAAGPVDVVAIGASTGGIHALTSLLQALPPDFRAPIVVTQHLPAAFMPFFAGQLAGVSGRSCQVGSDPLVLRPDMIVVAPGDAHLVAHPLPGGEVAVRLCRTPVPSGNMPAVDPMFDSFADCFGPRLLAVVLSGMGRDGLSGAARVRDAGGSVVVQDRASSVVWGMPGAVAAAGLADAILSPAAIGASIARRRTDGA